LRGLYLAGDPLVRRKVHADLAGEFTSSILEEIVEWASKRKL
jgi:hypothetical protein